MSPLLVIMGKCPIKSHCFAPYPKFTNPSTVYIVATLAELNFIP